MKKVNLPIVFHFHQPVDNFDHVIESIYEKCYSPLLERIKTSKVKFTLHFTGSIIDWLEKSHPDYLDDVAELCSKKQVELISGGYYEPILAILPDGDKLGQIQMLNNKIEDRFGFKPRGFWLAERVWEPQLPRFLALCNLDYVIVDDNHLKSCGFEEEDTYYYYSTEDGGHRINIFPINEPIRYLAPWQPVWKVKEYLNSVRDQGCDRITVFMSDAEKMGEWGTTHELCYVQGHVNDNEGPYIDELFSMVGNTDWINTITLSECLDRYEPRSLIYLPTASYDKMEEWVLPTQTRHEMEVVRENLERNEIPRAKELNLERFIKGGFWRYFLVKYIESNNMHKKMLHVHSKLLKSIKKFGNRDEILKAKRELYKSQANDCYWHGQFGGIYLNFLRHSVYRHAIEAEKILEKLWDEKGEKLTPSLEKYSLFRDGKKQVLMQTSLVNAYINPADGGTIFELDFKPSSYNLMNILSRWKEAYHLEAETQHLVYDLTRKVALRDYIVKRNVELEEYRQNSFERFGDTHEKPYDVTHSSITDDRVGVDLERETIIDGKTITIEKKVILQEETKLLKIYYMFHEISEEFKDKYEFLLDFPIYFNGDPSKFKIQYNDVKQNPLDGTDFTVRAFSILDETYDLEVTFISSIPLRVIACQHETFARMNTDDYKTMYQGIGLAMIHDGSDFRLDITISKIQS
ncbi:MAG: alpha-amylase/4-alpha-glucanotransferase domain-containing protein [Candidatus Hodarchaeota archaeon]